MLRLHHWLFLVSSWPLFNTVSVSHGLLSTTTLKLIFPRLIWGKPRAAAAAAAEAALLSVVALQADRHLQDCGHVTRKRTHTHAECWHWFIHTGSQKYERRNEKNNSIYSQLTQPQPEAASSHRNGPVSGARLFVASWWWFCFVYLFTSPIKDAKKKKKMDVWGRQATSESYGRHWQMWRPHRLNKKMLLLLVAKMIAKAIFLSSCGHVRFMHRPESGQLCFLCRYWGWLSAYFRGRLPCCVSLCLNQAEKTPSCTFAVFQLPLPAVIYILLWHHWDQDIWRISIIYDLRKWERNKDRGRI